MRSITIGMKMIASNVKTESPASINEKVLLAKRSADSRPSRSSSPE